MSGSGCLIVASPFGVDFVGCAVVDRRAGVVCDCMAVNCEEPLFSAGPLGAQDDVPGVEGPAPPLTRRWRV